MRTLMVKLPQNTTVKVTDSFLSFSSKLKYRQPGYIFADITESVMHFGSEAKLLNELNQFNKDFFPKARVAIANTPASAQAICLHNSDNYRATNIKHEQEEINELPIKSLKDFEGLIAWSSVEEVEDIISYFKVLGHHKVGEVSELKWLKLKDRWGKTGELLWKKLNGKETQLITPLPNENSMIEHVDLQFPISLLPYLLYCLENQIRKALNQVKYENKEAYKLNIYLNCFYNYNLHAIEINPNKSDYLNLVYIYEQLEKHLSQIDLSNPIKSIDIEVLTQNPVIGKYKHWVDHQHTHKTTRLSTTENFRLLEEEYYNFEQEEHILMHGKQLRLNMESETSTAPSLRIHSLFDFQELSSEELNAYELICKVNHALDHLEEKLNFRGRTYFLATNKQGKRSCIMYDSIEDRYFITHDISY